MPSVHHQSDPGPSAWRLPVADLLRRPGSSRACTVEAPVEGLGASAASVPADVPVRLDGTLEQVGDGVVVRATIHAPWTAACSRCLRPVTGAVEVHVDELFEPVPLEGETYPLDDEAVDLEPLVRDALLLELPGAPRCGPDCAGICAICGADRNETPCDCATEDPDPRWAALRSLEL
jgi:uncharacterized protein